MGIKSFSLMRMLEGRLGEGVSIKRHLCDYDRGLYYEARIEGGIRFIADLSLHHLNDEGRHGRFLFGLCDAANRIKDHTDCIGKIPSPSIVREMIRLETDGLGIECDVRVCENAL